MCVTNEIKSIVKEAGYTDDVGLVFSNLYRYMKDKECAGMCHALSSVLYVALSELGYNPRLCIGEVEGEFPFDHSWILLDGKIVDFAISMPLPGSEEPAHGIVILGKEFPEMKDTAVKYGIVCQGLDVQAKVVMSSNFSDYMDCFPFAQNGLWDVLREVMGKDIDIDSLREKYKDVKREYIRDIV